VKEVFLGKKKLWMNFFGENKFRAKTNFLVQNIFLGEKNFKNFIFG